MKSKLHNYCAKVQIMLLRYNQHFTNNILIHTHIIFISLQIKILK